MDTIDPVRFIVAFIFVLALIGVMSLVLRRYASMQNIYVPQKLFGKKLPGGAQENGRLGVVEVRYIDARRKLVLVRRDKAEHLLLLADGREVVLETNIKGDER